jgi:uncharacterized protein (TIGR00730 family)
MTPRLEMLVESCGADPHSHEGRLAVDLIRTAFKSLSDQTGVGERKLMTRSLKEIRHAYRVFAGYPETRKVSIFGSARTPADHPDYAAAVSFSRDMANLGWLAITGAGDGIMKAGHEGPGSSASFGLAIRLPFETTANTIITGDEKLIHFNYFFTRKLIFLSHSDAVAAFPGGLGTQDELLETMTLMQTGKSPITPIVLVAGESSDYWQLWSEFMSKGIADAGLADPEDLQLAYIAASPRDAVEHVQRFYANYHSARYVGNEYVLRVREPLRPWQLQELQEEFSFLVADGRIRQSGALPEETDHLDLPRIRFEHTKRNYAAIRRLINRINDLHISSTGSGRPKRVIR